MKLISQTKTIVTKVGICNRRLWLGELPKGDPNLENHLKLANPNKLVTFTRNQTFNFNSKTIPPHSHANWIIKHGMNDRCQSIIVNIYLLKFTLRTLIVVSMVAKLLTDVEFHFASLHIKTTIATSSFNYNVVQTMHPSAAAPHQHHLIITIWIECFGFLFASLNYKMVSLTNCTRRLFSNVYMNINTYFRCVEIALNTVHFDVFSVQRNGMVMLIS